MSGFLEDGLFWTGACGYEARSISRMSQARKEFGQKMTSGPGAPGRSSGSHRARCEAPGDGQTRVAPTAFDPSGGSCYGARTLRRLRYLVTGAQAPRAAFRLSFSIGPTLALTLALGSAGCGPIEYLNQVSGKAAGAVAAAKRANADRFAPYEYTAAVEYLHKAREEGSSAEYQVAIEYGRRAEDLATRARAIAEVKGPLSHPGNQAVVSPEPSLPEQDSH